jgi:aminoglycoside phosphotransferase (APT) family kinase protein
LHARIHEKLITGLPSYKDRLRYDIGEASLLPDELRQKVLALLDQLPDGQNLCHGDFHPANVFLTKNGPVAIDWMTACYGSPSADVARTSLILSIGAKAAGRQVNPLIRAAIQLYHRTYLDRYRAFRQDTANELRRWTPVIAAARLSENITPEREALITIVHEGLAE